MSSVLIAILAWSLPARANIPPAFFIYAKVAEQREQSSVPSVSLTVSRPAAGATEDPLGTVSLPSWAPQSDGWPVLSLILEPRSENLISAVENFGLPIPREQDLLRMTKEQAAAMKDPPNPFYKTDHNVTLKRHRQTYAWVHLSPEDRKKSVWIEKDTFLPLKVAAPCPEVVKQLPWAKAGDGLCEVEFRNVWNLRRGSSPAGAKIILSKDGNPILYFSFDRISYPKPGAPTSGGEPAFTVPENIRQIALTILH